MELKKPESLNKQEIDFCELFIFGCDPYARFSGYCSVTFLRKYTLMLVFIPVASVLMPCTSPPKYVYFLSLYSIIFIYQKWKPKATQHAINNRFTIEIGTRYFHSRFKIWSIRKRGKVHLIHIRRNTTKNALAKNQIKPGI